MFHARPTTSQPWSSLLFGQIYVNFPTPHTKKHPNAEKKAPWQSNEKAKSRLE